MPKGIKGFQKGQVTNPTGRQRLPDAVKELRLKLFTDEALNCLKILKEIRDNPKVDERVRVAAADSILDRCMPKLKAFEIEGQVDHRFTIIREYTNVPDKISNQPQQLQSFSKQLIAEVVEDNEDV